MSLKVIGLISGGKDSLFSLAHCVKNGHTIVALGNLFPPIQSSGSGSVECRDMDSFMYQTVGHTILPLYADALEVIPTTLAENAGLNPIAIVTELRNRHALGEKNAGINVRKVCCLPCSCWHKLIFSLGSHLKYP